MKCAVIFAFHSQKINQQIIKLSLKTLMCCKATLFSRFEHLQFKAYENNFNNVPVYMPKENMIHEYC